ncbi:MAG: hypothetical protein J3K34DRAFT_458897 [Monoraphidium minutum]|nr:MAG: hypothetical protein J3K34DRAFT_458897 [Monoraphidium minutum]
MDAAPPAAPGDPAAAAAAAGAAPGAPSLTFAWLGEPSPDAGGGLLFYGAFQFCGVTYGVGDHVYLTPEDAGAPLYLARITAAFEDTGQQGGDRLCVEVQWYERRANMPPALQEGMHEREVVEWLQTDTNLVGCIERRANVIKAHSYEEAVAQLGPEAAGGEWHFCRGVLEVDSMEFRTYDEVDADPGFFVNQRTGQVMRLPPPGVPGIGGRGMQPDLDLFKSSPAPSKRGQRRRGGGGGMTWDRAAGAAAALGGMPPKPGTMCYECGAKATPQWREGPAGGYTGARRREGGAFDAAAAWAGGPRTLCNACGMRYQRSQGKCITRPKPFGELEPPRRGGGGFDPYYGTGPPAAVSPARPNKRPAAGRGAGGGGKRPRGGGKGGGGGGGGGGGRAPWEGEDGDDLDYDPSFDARGGGRGAGGYARHFAEYGDEEDEEEGGEGEGQEEDEADLAVAAAAAAAFGFVAPGALGAAAQLPQLLAAAAPPPPAPAPAARAAPPPGGGAGVTPAELRGLVVRAAAFLPGLMDFAPALDVLSDDALLALPPGAASALAGAKAGVEAGLSEAKAADAAVAAVSTVLAQKKAAAERAHAGAAAAAAEFRELIAGVLERQQQQQQQQQQDEAAAQEEGRQRQGEADAGGEEQERQPGVEQQQNGGAAEAPPGPAGGGLATGAAEGEEEGSGPAGGEDGTAAAEADAGAGAPSGA